MRLLYEWDGRRDRALLAANPKLTLDKQTASTAIQRCGTHARSRAVSARRGHEGAAARSVLGAPWSYSPTLRAERSGKLEATRR